MILLKSSDALAGARRAMGLLLLTGASFGCADDGAGTMSQAVQMPIAGNEAGSGGAADEGAFAGTGGGAPGTAGAGGVGGSAAAGMTGEIADAGGVTAAGGSGGTAGASAADAGGMIAADAGGAGDGGALPCGGDTPHGCYVPQAGNHPMCPPHTPEQSAFYPPAEEWNGCNGIMPAAPFGGDPEASCSYAGPAGEVATCLCDTGLHWLCTYPQ